MGGSPGSVRSSSSALTGRLVGLAMAVGSASATAGVELPILADGFETRLLVQVTNAGGGNVVSVPAGIDCGTTCSALFPPGTLVALTAAPTADAVFLGWNGGCTGVGSCAFELATANVGVTASFGQPLGVTRSGTGVVQSSVGGIDCGSTCVAVVPHGTNVVLQARTSNGSNSSFTSWSGDCAGSFRDCSLSMTAMRSVTATFSSMTNNLAFVSSATFSTTLGNVAPYDAQCNSLATSAGINDAIGTSYVAWMSSSTINVLTRIGPTARGWVRLDGAPVADTQAELINNSQLYNPIDRNEVGARVVAQLVLTGTSNNGTASGFNCANWTAAGSGFATFGDSSGGPVNWTSFNNFVCQPARIYCLMRTRTTALNPPPAAGLRIWFTTTAFAPGSGTTPDQACNAVRPAGVAIARAVIATSSAPAAAALVPGATYVRLDGQVVGTGAEIAVADIRTGIWQATDGTYPGTNLPFAWTGHAGDLTAIGTLAGTCMDWSSSSGNGGAGQILQSDARWWDGGTRACNSSNARLICTEQ